MKNKEIEDLVRDIERNLSELERQVNTDLSEFKVKTRNALSNIMDEQVNTYQLIGHLAENNTFLLKCILAMTVVFGLAIIVLIFLL